MVFEQNDEARRSYFNGRCDAYSTDASQLAGLRASFPNPEEHVILPDIISKEPHSPVVRHGDDQWFDIVRWTFFALLTAEELGVTQANLDESLRSENPEIRRLLGLSGDHGPLMGLDRRWAYNIIRAVGNYGEVFERNLGAGQPHQAPARPERPLHPRRPDVRAAHPLRRGAPYRAIASTIRARSHASPGSWSSTPRHAIRTVQSSLSKGSGSAASCRPPAFCATSASASASETVHKQVAPQQHLPQHAEIRQAEHHPAAPAEPLQRSVGETRQVAARRHQHVRPRAVAVEVDRAGRSGVPQHPVVAAPQHALLRGRRQVSPMKHTAVPISPLSSMAGTVR